MISVANSFSGKPRQASMAAYRQLLAENHVEEILQDVKQNKNLDRKKELPVWLPLACGALRTLLPRHRREGADGAALAESAGREPH